MSGEDMPNVHISLRNIVSGRYQASFARIEPMRSMQGRRKPPAIAVLRGLSMLGDDVCEE
jgi:hypothetical protein